MTARTSTLNRLRTLTAGGTLLLGITLWTASRSQSIEKPDAPLKVALVLDSITQPRFQEDLKNFGMSRLLPAAGGHLVAGQLLLPTQKDRALFKTAESAHRDFLIGFVHCANLPGHARKVLPISHPAEPSPKRPTTSKEKSGLAMSASDPTFTLPATVVSPICNHLGHLYATRPTTASAEETALYQEMSKAAHKALPILIKGEGAEQASGDWLIVTRPVRAMKASCLKCHEGAKLGDTLGAMAYAVSKKTFADPFPHVAGGPGRGGH